MPSKLLPMKLSGDEEHFLRRWIYDEVHYQEGMGPAKQLQLHHQVRPADLAILIARRSSQSRRPGSSELRSTHGKGFSLALV